MKLVHLTLFLALALPGLAADAAAGNWDRVGQIPKTQKVKIYLQSGDVLEGVIQDVGPDGLTFIQKTQVTQLKREDISRVTKKSRAKGALIGAAILGGIGAAIGTKAQIADRKPTAGDRAAGVVLVGGLFGAIGAAIGAGAGWEQPLYKAGPAVKPAAKAGAPPK
jgi:hypothetical protein